MGNNNELFWRLVEKEHHRARAFCYRLTGNLEDGDDLYQDSVIKAYRGFAALNQIEAFRPWLYRIIGNAYKSRCRCPWWKKIIPLKPENESQPPVENPESLYESRRLLHYAFSILKPEDRLLVTLAEIEGWKISELAQLAGKSEGFVKMRLARARQKMRRQLSRRYKTTAFQNSPEGIQKICTVTKPEND
ncbi:MAG: RNA polymerase sigma factor [Candidatus Zixiibacteriota bacterium]